MNFWCLVGFHDYEWEEKPQLFGPYCAEFAYRGECSCCGREGWKYCYEMKDEWL